MNENDEKHVKFKSICLLFAVFIFVSCRYNSRKREPFTVERYKRGVLESESKTDAKRWCD